MNNPILLIDASNIFFRAAIVNEKNGVPYGAETTFLRIITGLMKNYQTNNVKVVWDSNCLWRKEVFPAYKGSKVREDFGPFKLVIAEKLAPFRTVLSWVLPQYSCSGCEADDVIAALSLWLSSSQVYIVSSDQDMWQLVTENVGVLKPISGGGYEKISFNDVCKRWAVEHPSELRWLRAYIGDQSDNIPGSGIPRKLISKYVIKLPQTRKWNFDEIIREQEIIEERVNQFLTRGWKKRAINFHDQALINYRIMSLTPPRLGPYITCDYNPDLNKLLDWLRTIGAESMMSRMITHFSVFREKDFLEKPYLGNPWTNYETLQRLEQAIPASKGGK